MHDDLISDGYYQYFASCPRPPDSPPFTQGCHVFQWANVNHFGGGGPWSQWAILYDTSMDMVFQIGSGNPEHGAGSTTGIQNPGATIGLTYACDTADSIPDNTAVVFLANLDIFCYVDEMIRNNNGTMTLLGFCNSIDLYAFVASNPVFLGSYVLDGELTVDISGFEGSLYLRLLDRLRSVDLNAVALQHDHDTHAFRVGKGRVPFLFSVGGAFTSSDAVGLRFDRVRAIGELSASNLFEPRFGPCTYLACALVY